MMRPVLPTLLTLLLSLLAVLGDRTNAITYHIGNDNRFTQLMGDLTVPAHRQGNKWAFAGIHTGGSTIQFQLDGTGDRWYISVTTGNGFNVDEGDTVHFSGAHNRQTDLWDYLFFVDAKNLFTQGSIPFGDTLYNELRFGVKIDDSWDLGPVKFSNLVFGAPAPDPMAFCYDKPSIEGSISYSQSPDPPMNVSFESTSMCGFDQLVLNPGASLKSQWWSPKL